MRSKTKFNTFYQATFWKQNRTNNLIYARKNGYAPPANMEELTKAKNVKEVVKGWIGG
jgi:hypothetical protein